jgi:hypothetical protein
MARASRRFALVSPFPGHADEAIWPPPPEPRDAPVLLPFDLSPDRVGWTVIEIATDRPASLDGVVLVGLSLEDAERLVNALNALELRCADLARRRVLDDLGVAWLYDRCARGV